jgi:hypothetical protein
MFFALIFTVSAVVVALWGYRAYLTGDTSLTWGNWFGLPPEPVGEQLEADEKALGVDRRRYLQRVLMARYHQVLEKGPGFEKKPGAAGKPGR